MTRPIDVVIPTLRHAHAWECLESLRLMPWPMRLHLMSGGGSWAKAVNLGLRQTTFDVVLMDDDVTLLPETFSDLDEYYDEADMFGFKLLFPDGRIQHAGGFMRDGLLGHLGYGVTPGHHPYRTHPYYVCHATTSLIYIKRTVLDALGEMAEDYPGYQYEDVDFSFRALKAGFKILYLPGAAIHRQSATKSTLPDFQVGMEQSFAELKRRHYGDQAFIDLVESYPKVAVNVEQISSV